MFHKAFFVAATIVLSPVAAFAATTAPVVTSNTPVATPDKATTALKMAPKAKHHGHVKKDKANAKAPS